MQLALNIDVNYLMPVDVEIDFFLKTGVKSTLHLQI